MHMPDRGATFPGGFSPVRTNRAFNSVSPPEIGHRSDESLYASFSPPRRPMANPGPSTSAKNNSSIFRPKQLSVIVARDSSNDDSSSITYGSHQQRQQQHHHRPYHGYQHYYSNHHHSPPPKELIPSSAASKPNATFPSKLHEILSSPEFQDLITWLPHGRAFRVLKSKDFEERIIPKFFRSSKYASFMRQVNFSRL